MNAYKKFSYYYDEIMAKLNYDLWLEFIEPYLKPNDSILDLACGTATLCTMLKLKGYNPEGLDLSETILEIAKEKMKINHLDFPLYQKDMTNFHLTKKYDLITCFFDSVNFLNSVSQIQNLLNCVYQHLKPNGYFIFDIFSKQMMKEYETHHWQEDFITFQLDWKTVKASPTSLKHLIKIQEGDTLLKETYYEYYYDISQLMDQRFKLIKISGDFNEDIEPTDERILIVLQKL